MSRSFTIASNQGSMGGGEVMLLSLAEAARELGRDVTIVAPADPPLVVDEAKLRGFRVVAIEGRNTAQYLRNLRRWDAKHRRGLLWCNGLRPALATAGHPDRVVHLHQLPAGKLRALAKLAAHGATRVVVPSPFMARSVEGAEVLWNWSEEMHVPRSVRSDDRPFTLGFLGRLSTDKGIDVLCRAMEQLERRHPGRYRLVLAGESRFVDAAEADRIDTAINALGAAATRKGWVDPEEFFASVDLAVFPSVATESFGLVVAEAMSARVPFVISDSGALPEVACEGHPWIVPAGDASALADTIEAAAADPGRGLDEARQRWEEHFSPTAGRERLRALLDDIDPPPTDPPRVALAHDYLTQRGGAERVALSLAQQFPDAELTTTVYTPDGTYPEFADVDVNPSWIDHWRILHKDFRLGLAFYGIAFSTTPAGRDADVMVVSTTGYAHGIRTKAPKLVYCHSPARFLYLVDDYLGKPWWKTPVGWVLMALRPALIAWDQRAARSAHTYLANSTVVRQRIKDVYGIDAKVVHPPFAIDPDAEQEPIDLPADEFYVVVSRLMPYKNVDVVIDAFRGMPDRHLLVIGRGPLRDQLRANLPSNVTMAEGISDAQMRWAYANATAVIAPSKEDFGLTPVEGFAFGTPTLALRAGGYLDTVVEGVSGWFFDDATPDAVRAAVAHLDEHPLDEEKIREHAQRFSPEAFAAAIDAEIRKVVKDG